MNICDLKAELARNNLSIPKLAKIMKTNKKTLYSRFNGKVSFKQKEISSIAKVLNLSEEQIISIFFTT